MDPASPPAATIVEAVSAAPSSFQSTVITRAPRLARTSAASRPIPDPPPVTSATLPSNSLMCRSSLVALRKTSNWRPQGAPPPAPPRSFLTERGEFDPARQASVPHHPSPAVGGGVAGRCEERAKRAGGG